MLLPHHAVSKKISFLCITSSSEGLSLQLFVNGHRFWLLCLFIDRANSTIDFAICCGCCFVDRSFVPPWIIGRCGFLPKRRFDGALHLFNPRTGIIVHMQLLIFQRIWEIISSNLFDNAVTQDYDFLCLLWIVIFSRSSVGLIVTKIYWRLLLFGLILKWCTWLITTLIFFTDSRIVIYVCTYNVFTICVVISCPLVSLKIFITVFISFCNFFNCFKWII